MNVIIGGRGSGKSTVVAAIRQLYSTTQTLPPTVRAEAEAFAADVLASATLDSKHRLPNSQERQSASWSTAHGQRTTTAAGANVQTSFSVRVINQKELFDRVSRDRSDPLAASRSFLAFLDDGLGLLRSASPRSGAWWRRFEDATQAWMQRAMELRRLEEDIAQLPEIRAKIAELSSQVAAFDSEEAKSRRERNEAKLAQRESLNELRDTVIGVVEQVKHAQDTQGVQARGELPADVAPFAQSLQDLEERFKSHVKELVSNAEAELELWQRRVDVSEWAKSVADAENDSSDYLAELKSKGVDPAAYGALKSDLAAQMSTERMLAAMESRLLEAMNARLAAWNVIENLLLERRTLRQTLLTTVTKRSGRLRFRLKPHRDVIGWANAIRELLSLRTDAFLDDVPQLARWIWEAPADERDSRWAAWRDALVNGNFERMAGKYGAISRPDWQRRLEKVDPAIRMRLASEVADDAIEIAFLRDDGRPERDADWQDISQGSPGQRTAAMLGFVLHHGDEPLVLDQPEDDLDTEWISSLVVQELRASRWKRQLIVVTHNANIPVIGDAERIVVLESKSGALRIRESNEDGRVFQHCGAIELGPVREDIQNIMEGGIRAFIHRERRYGSEPRFNAVRRRD